MKIEISNELMERFKKACKQEDWDCDIIQFIERNLELTGN